MSLNTQTRPPSEVGTLSERRQRHWLGLPVRPAIKGTFDDVLNALPHFGRQPFAMASLNGEELGINSYLDMVYRLPTRQSERPVPLGVVSKNYRLLDHHQILRTVQQSMATRKLDIESVQVVAEWTIHGERAHFSIIFPPEERFIIGTVGDKDDMRFRIEVFNSVDGSCRLMAIAGWLRFVCANGLIIGTALMQLQQQHRQQLEIEELGRRVGEAIECAQSDKARFAQWMSAQVDESVLVPWIDEEVRSLWGVKAAVRVLGITTDGWDVEPVGAMTNRKPSEIGSNRISAVPGLDPPVRNLFGVAQVLSWIAGQRAEIGEDLEWRSQVQALIGKLEAVNA
jgi:Domain of unknown function (DUF932)